MPHKASPVLPQGPFHAVAEWFRRQARAREFDALGGEELRLMAADLRISVDDLRDAALQSEDEAALMRRMLALHGLDPARIGHEMPELMRDMTLTCARCAEKGRCAHDLDDGLEPAEAGTFCPNADAMAALAR
jgi:tRNA C32,U32 (ribose-2'-O)-methylase TrmJ